MALKDELVQESTKKVPNVTSETLETKQKIGAAGLPSTSCIAL